MAESAKAADRRKKGFRLHRMGRTDAEIAAALGVTRQTVIKDRERHLAKVRLNLDPTREESEQLAASYKSEMEDVLVMLWDTAGYLTGEKLLDALAKISTHLDRSFKQMQSIGLLPKVADRHVNFNMDVDGSDEEEVDPEEAKARAIEKIKYLRSLEQLDKELEGGL